MAKHFPRHPGKADERPFEDAEGNNPFADELSGSAVEANPFSPPASSTGRTYETPEYETQSPHRAGQILLLGGVGCAIASLGLFAAAVSAWAATTIAWGLFLILPAQCLSLAVALPAWLMGSRDRQAMRVQAMDPTGLAQTELGLRLGQAAVFLSLLPIFFLIGSFVWSSVAAW